MECEIPNNQIYKFEGNLEFKNEMFIYNQQVVDKLPLKMYFKSSIYEAGTHYQDEYWNKYNVYPLSTEEANFIQNKAKIQP